MIGETPQPAETPRDEGNPWSIADPETSWWHSESDRAASDPPAARKGHDPRRKPAEHQTAAGGVSGGTGTLLPPGETERPRIGPAAEAHAAATRDVAEQLDPEANTEPVGAERDHHHPDPHRYDPMRPPAGHQARRAAQTVAADYPVVAADEIVFRSAAPAEGPEPDVMVLPDPASRNRATVRLTHRRPERATGPLPPATGSPDTDARLERLENSPFWVTEESATEPLPAQRPAHTRIRRHNRPPRRRLVAPMFALVALALVSAFFAWVSAEPFWLAAGHGDRGYTTTTRCTGQDVTQRCVGRFSAQDGSFVTAGVTLLGVGASERVPGAMASGHMVSRESHRAYLGESALLLQLRWVLGFALVLFCGYAIAGVTGARRLETARARRGAVLTSLAGPLLLLAGFLFAAW